MRFTVTSQSGLDLHVGCPRYLLRTLLSSQPQIWIFPIKKSNKMTLVGNHYIIPKFTCTMIQNVNQNDVNSFLTRAMINNITAVSEARNAA